MLEVYRGSCFDLAELAPTIDLLDCDPPYRQEVHGKATSNGVQGGGRGVHSRDLGFAHLGYPMRAYLATFASQVKRWSLIYSDVESASRWRITCEVRGLEYIRPVPWIRWSQPQLSGDRPPTGCEFLSVFHRSAGLTKRGQCKPIKKHWNGRGNLIELEGETDQELSALRHTALRQSKSKPKHMCEKPLDQKLDTVMWFSDPGELVADLTAGAFTVGTACALLGREFIGAETDEAWADRGEIRMLEAAEGKLSERDATRVRRWIEATTIEAKAVPMNKPEDLKAWERAQRRLADVKRVRERTGL